ncbi:hypothetical protein HDA40_005697 [Hamadaea flava]|uniref:Uncharacterized protein n=1 Tax=Hamadaea flava TaxID=1742688 RepID=A0ABV8LQR0_9ACTN|nr:hypothetical protein [Hamadaea flava]MCP2327190.1 hypothetical protein [Hamadaea flava]
MIAGIGAKDRPFYARALGLHYVRPSGLLCFFFFEGAIALATLLALAELVTWWAVVVLPGAIAIMVKINDLIAGFGARSAARAQARAAVRSATRRAAKREAKAARRQAALASAAADGGPAQVDDEDLLEEAPAAVGRASVPQPYAGLAAPDEVRSSRARRRQSAAHRYD